MLAYIDLHVSSASVPAMYSLLGDEGNELLIISPLLQGHTVMTEDLRGRGKWVWLNRLLRMFGNREKGFMEEEFIMWF